MEAVDAGTFAEDARWFVVYTKPRAETQAEEHLQRQSFTTYLPRLKHSRYLKGRWRDVIVPLFPRYLFVRLVPGVENIAPIRSTRGVTGFVRFGQQLAFVPDAIVDSLRLSEDSALGARETNRPLFGRGDRIQVVQGALAGLEAIFEASSGEERVVILLSILGREENRVTLPRSDIRPASGW